MCIRDRTTTEAITKWVAGKGKWLNFSLTMCGAYLKDGEVTFYHQFQGQGTDVNVLDKTYDKITDLTEVINNYAKGLTTKEQTVEMCIRDSSLYAAELTQEVIIDYSDEALEEALEQRWKEDRQKVLDSVAAMLDVRAEKVYLRCLETLYPEYAKDVADGIENGKLKYCDMFACALVKAILGQIRIDVHIKHAVIDEAQDYPYILYKTLNIIYPKCRFTVLGDPVSYTHLDVYKRQAHTKNGDAKTYVFRISEKDYAIM